MTAPAYTFEYKTPPMIHQRGVLKRMAKRPAFALFWEVGCAKTHPILNEAAWHWKRGEIDTLVVFAPSGVHEQWVTDQVVKHLPDWCPRRALVWDAGSIRVRRNFEEAVGVYGDLLILCFNIETIARDTGLKLVQRLLKGRACTGVIDESHSIKRPSANTSRNAWKLRPYFTYRRILTGTEIAKGYHDLYSQFRFLDPAIIGCNSYTEFKAEYCNEDQYHRVVGYRNLDKLLAKIEPYCMVVEIKDCPDLKIGPRRFIERVVPMTLEQKRLTKDLRDQFLTTLGEQEIDAQLAITRLQKFQQIAAGHIRDNDGAWHPVPTNSFDAVVDLIQQVRGKVILWSDWQPDIAQLSVALKTAGITAVTVYGGNTKATNRDNIERFKTDEQVQVIVATPSSMSEGHNLQMAQTMIFHTLSFNYIDYKQSLGRNYRPGQLEMVTVYTIVRPGSPDRRLIATHADKQELASTLRGGGFKRWLVDLAA